MTQCVDCLAEIYGLAAIVANSLAGVALLGAGSILGAGDGGILVLAAGSGLFTLSGLTVELAVEAIVGKRAGTDSGVGLIVSGAEPVGLAIDLSDHSLVGGIIGIDSGRSGLINTVDMGTADHHIDVGLGTVNVSIQIVAAGGLFQINIQRSILIGTGCEIIGSAHAADQVVDIGSRNIFLHHAELVGRTGNRVLDHAIFAGAAHSAGAADKLVTGRNLIALIASGAQRAGVDGVAVSSAGSGDGSACHIVMLAADSAGSFAGGSGHQRRHIRAEQQERKFGIVNEDVAGAGNGLNGVVTTQLPGIHGVQLHPQQQNIQAFHNALRSPGGILAVAVDIAPTNIDIQENTGHVAAQIQRAVGFAVGIVIAATLTIGSIAAGGVFDGGGGAEHHDVVFIITSQALAVGPGMLTVERTVPSGADLQTGIERGDLSAVVLAIRVLVQVLGSFIAGLGLVCILHQLLKGCIQRTVGCIGSAGATSQSGQSSISIAAGVECIRIRGEEGCLCSAGTPVVDVLTGRVIYILNVGSICSNQGGGQQAQAQYQYHNQSQTALHEVSHNAIPLFYFSTLCSRLHTPCIISYWKM